MPTQQELSALQRKCVSFSLDFELLPVEGEQYPQDLIFTPADMTGRYFKNIKGQRLLCAFIEQNDQEKPHVCFIPDFTRERMGEFYGLSGGNWTEQSIHWRNMQSNIKDMQFSLDRLPHVDTVYCVGSGPALMRNWRELEQVKKNPRARIIGCNELLQYLPAGLLDYYLAFDGCSPDKWWEKHDCSGTEAIFGPCIPPSFKLANWKRVLWFKIGLESKFNSYVRKHRPSLSTVIPIYGVGPTELSIAWHMKPKNIILVGHSYAYDRVNGIIHEHINEPLTPERWEGVLRSIAEFATTDINGQPIVTDYHVLITGMATLAACQVLLDAGVRVINATEGGILRSNPALPAYANKPIFPERAKLADVVRELA